jgi:hypothetical protein
MKSTNFRAQKVRPFIFFLLCSLCSIAVAGYGFYVIIELTSFYYQARCSSALFIESLFNK